MNKAAAVLFALLLTSASAATLPEIFTPSPEVLRKACADSYRIGAMPQKSQQEMSRVREATAQAVGGRTVFDVRSSKGEDPLMIIWARSVAVQAPIATAFMTCARDAARRAPMPTRFSDGIFTVVYVGDQVPDLKAVEGWTAVVALLDAGGKELARFQPVKTVKAAQVPADAKSSEIGQWEKACASGVCNWMGSNAYHFDLGVFPKGVKTVRVIYTRGQGTDQRDYTPASFTQDILTGPG